MVENRTPFIIGISLNIIYVLLEAFAGWKYNSLALISDAGHNLSDVGAILLAWLAFSLASKKSTHKHTYGFSKATILIALTNGITLMVAIGAILYESIQRLMHALPVQSAPMTVVVVALLGVFINSATALLFMKSENHDLNIRGVFLHMVADAAISFGVVVAGLIIYFTKANWLDPVASILICVAIGFSAWRLVKSSLHLAMSGVPEQINALEVAAYLQSQPGVVAVYDLHIWAISTTQNALTVHLVRDRETLDDSFLKDISKGLESKFGIDHATIQVEREAIYRHSLFC